MKNRSAIGCQKNVNAWNGCVILAQRSESPLEANVTLVLALLRGVANCILLKNGAYSGVFTLGPLDNSPDRRMMMANHAEKRIVPPFTNVVRSVAVIESGLMHIPYRRWKSGGVRRSRRFVESSWDPIIRKNPLT